jgi:bifunctional non-homologous end joining protein LigD
VTKQDAKSSKRELGEYRRKRDPLKTNEPFAAERPTSSSSTTWGRFVVHLHDATRLHYDLRLQVGDVLKSFPIPKGPTLDPAEKRLAIQTEDHPLEYLNFEDVIPDGNYGAGAMVVWDTGVVRYLEQSVEAGLNAGKIDFVLEGYKLRGRFALVETTHRAKRETSRPPKQRQWLLLKKKDAFSRATDPIIEVAPRSVLSGLTVEQLPHKDSIAAAIEQSAQSAGGRRKAIDARSLTPMLCAQDGAELDDPERIYELKLDGVRILAKREGGTVSLRYRSHRLANANYPEIVSAMRSLVCDDLLLDGEIVAFDSDGRPSFQKLGSRIHARRPQEVKRAQSEVAVVYLVFDVLQIGQYDLRGVPLLERKALLRRVAPPRGPIHVLDHIEGDGHALFNFCTEERLEGIVAKRSRSTYRVGPRRSKDWVKVKCERDDDFVVVAWERKARSRRIGSLWVASYEEGRLVYRGRVGSGLDETMVDSLLSEFGGPDKELDACPAIRVESARAGSKEVHFVEPGVVVKVRYLGWTDQSSLRHPVLLGIREDLAPEACRVLPAHSMVEPQDGDGDERSDEAQVAELPLVHEPGGRGRAVLTNQQKVFWPDEGTTKGDLCEYYAAISPVLVPFLRGRPIMLVRYPDGIEGKSFYQWRVPQGTPDWIRRLQLRDPDDKKHGGKDVTTFMVDDVDGLLHIANLGCIPIHILAGTEENLDLCTFLTVDFDLKGAPFEQAIVLALSLRELLDELQLPSFPKTSGQTGLHVLIPMGFGVPFETARILVELLGRLLHARHPDISTLERRIEKRAGRVYIDTGQTGRSRTIVAPYSVRAAPGATVSTPLFWEELSRALDPASLTISTVPERVARRGDPLAGFRELRPDVAEAVNRLAGLMPNG